MGKVMEIDVICPDCGWEMIYHSYKKSSELEGDRRMKCKRCNRSFKVLDQRKSKVSKTRKDSDTPFGWHKYSKNN